VRVPSGITHLFKLALLAVLLWVGSGVVSALARPHSSYDLLLAQQLGKTVKTYNSPDTFTLNTAEHRCSTMQR
jgi:hypothetical protein